MREESRGPSKSKLYANESQEKGTRQRITGPPFMTCDIGIEIAYINKYIEYSVY